MYILLEKPLLFLTVISQFRLSFQTVKSATPLLSQKKLESCSILRTLSTKALVLRVATAFLLRTGRYVLLLIVPLTAGYAINLASSTLKRVSILSVKKNQIILILSIVNHLMLVACFLKLQSIEQNLFCIFTFR